MQIEADYKKYKFLKQMVDEGIGDNADKDELHIREAWMKRSIATFRRLNAMSIEWRIRTKPAPYSGASQHPIPLEASTLFRTKPAGDSGASQQVFVI